MSDSPSPTHETILGAARTLFAGAGSADVSMADVAGAAGVSRATVFNQFGTKQALVDAIAEEVLAGYVAIVDNALDAFDVPVPVLIRELMAVMARGIEAQQEFYESAFREIATASVSPDAGGVSRRLRQAAVLRLVRLFSRGQAQGSISTDVAAEDLATAFDSLVFGVVTHWLYDDPGVPLVQRMQRVADVLLCPVESASAAEWNGTVPALYVPLPGGAG